jgi:hypothetical protein
MLRYWTRFTLFVYLLLMVGVLMLLGLIRMVGAPLAIQYGQFFPPEDMIFFHYVDVDHGLNVRQRIPMDVVTIGSSTLSPDGKQRVTAIQNANSADLFIITEDGARQHIAHLDNFLVAPSEGARKIPSPTWSPDGGWITFVTTNENGSPDLYILRPDGSGLRRVGRISDRGAAMLPRWVRVE